MNLSQELKNLQDKQAPYKKEYDHARPKFESDLVILLVR